jgi:hypothetical protein
MKTTLIAAALGLFLSAPVLAQMPPRPVFITDQPVATQPSKEPVAFFSVLTFETGAVAVSDIGIFTVPEGRRLVLEYVSVDSSPTACTFDMFTGLSLTTGGLSLGHDLPVAPSYPSNNGFRRSRMATPVKLYGDPGSSVNVLLNRSDTTCSSVMTLNFSGYLEDAL